MFGSTAIIIDGSGDNVKVAAVRNGGLLCALESGSQSIESLASCVESLPCGFGEVKAYAVCTGPGSMLGIRFSSAYVSTFASLSGAEIYEWDAMLVAARFITGSVCDSFSLVAPSRKGCVNLLNYGNGGLELKSEIVVDALAPHLKAKRFHLFQRKGFPVEIDGFKKIFMTPQSIFETLKENPDLLLRCDFPPDAKPLSKREYVKWKDQAHI